MTARSITPRKSVSAKRAKIWKNGRFLTRISRIYTDFADFGSSIRLICTSENDDSVGETLPWSTGNPWVNSHGNPMLEFDYYGAGQPAAIQHVRFSHATNRQ